MPKFKLTPYPQDGRVGTSAKGAGGDKGYPGATFAARSGVPFPGRSGYTLVMGEGIATNDLVSLLAWYRDMGVDAALGESPVNWLAQDNCVPGADLRSQLRGRSRAGASSAEVAPSPSSPPSSPPAFALARSIDNRASVGRAPPQGMSGSPGGSEARHFPTAAPLEAVSNARAAAGSATSLGELHQILAGFDGCALKATAKNLCFYRGSETARIMIIGEAPGRDEDLAGKPFVGRAGRLLDKMLAAIDLAETDVHITNVVYWRPPGNRTPSPQETQICRPFLQRQIELVAPEVILALGGAAAKSLFDQRDGIMRLRGKWRDLQFGGTKVKAVATLHPAYLLRTPVAKRLAWRDLQMAKAALRS